MGWWAWLFSTGCFVIYFIHSLLELYQKMKGPSAVAKQVTTDAKEFAGGDVIKFGEMVAKLIEAFSKLSGAALSLAGSVAFMFIAIYSAK